MDTLLEQSQGLGPIFTAAPVGLEQQGLDFWLSDLSESPQLACTIIGFIGFRIQGLGFIRFRTPNTHPKRTLRVLCKGAWAVRARFLQDFC